MLSAADRREVKRAKALLQAGDRAGALVALRRLEAVPGRSAFDVPAQLVLRFMTFRCDRLDGEDVPACVCIARQAKSDVQRTQQTSRGQGTDHPSCDSRTCEQGRRIREALDPDSSVTWKGAGPGGRFERGRQGRGSGGAVEGSGA
jgi:hypothetical protein